MDQILQFMGRCTKNENVTVVFALQRSLTSKHYGYWRHIMKIRYSRTRHLGNHETETLEVQSEIIPKYGVFPQQRADECLQQLKEFVDAQMGSHDPANHLSKSASSQNREFPDYWGEGNGTNRQEKRQIPGDSGECG
jgi:hypothetical protein